MTVTLDLSGLVDGTLADVADVTVPLQEIQDALNGDTAITPEIAGGTIDGAVIGGATPAAATVTELNIAHPTQPYCSLYRNGVLRGTLDHDGDYLTFTLMDEAGDFLVWPLYFDAATGEATFEADVTLGGKLTMASDRPFLRLNDTSSDLFAGAFVWSRNGVDYCELVYHPGEDKMAFYDSGASGAVTVHIGKKSLTIGGETQPGTNATNTLMIMDGTPPASSPAGAVQLFADDVAGTVELRVRDSAGNVSTQSPHNPQMVNATGRPTDYVHKEHNPYTGRDIEIDVYRAVELVQASAGETLIHIQDLPPGRRENPYLRKLANRRAEFRSKMHHGRPD